ncbi:DUF6279 family lipoprotein [Pseudomonas sp. DC3000-4b1]|uniref:DUF6279 family lipoprotein n=1 Tax=unclassified Pseudomonas TaxID=196821 RepID=UPI003CECEEF6
MRRWLALLWLLGLLALAGCTRMDLAYRNLDTLIPWTLDDYLDMNREQKLWFEDRLAEHLRWHCQTQLPGYLPWLDRFEQGVAERSLDDQALRTLTGEAEQAAAAVAVQITPSAVELLQQLNDQQVSDLKVAFAKDIAKRHAEKVAPPLEEQIQKRASNMIKRLEAWLGDLHPQQVTAVQSWARQLGEHDRIALEARARWQRALLEALAHRREPGFDTRVAQLLQRRDSLWPAAYKEERARSEAAARQLTLELLRLSDADQRGQLIERLQHLRERFASLRCLNKPMALR